jgi:fructooligosaccharide transport system substrate-binding protein
MKRFRTFSILTVMVVGTMLLAAFAPTPAIQFAISSDNAISVAAQDQDPVVLTFIKIADELEAQALDVMIEEWRMANDGEYSYVTVEFNALPFSDLMTGIQTAVATGQPVDLIQADAPNLLNFAVDGVIQPQTADWSEDELALFAPQSLDEATIAGEFYGPPMRQSCSVMWYNTEMVAAAGLEVPEGIDAVTYEDALAIWQQIATDENGDGVPDVYGVELGQNPYWGDYEYRVGARSAGEPGSPTYEGVGPDGIVFDGYFNTPEAIEAYQFIQSLYTEHNVATAEPVPNSFLAQSAAFYISPARVVGVRNDQFPDMPEIRATNAPYFNTPLCHTGSWHYGVSTTTENYEETMALIKYLTSDEAAATYYDFLQQMPANVALLNSLPEWQEYPRSFVLEFFRAYGTPRITSPAYTQFDALYQEFYLSLITGGDAEALANEYAALMTDAASIYEGWRDMVGEME